MSNDNPYEAPSTRSAEDELETKLADVLLGIPAFLALLASIFLAGVIGWLIYRALTTPDL